MKRSGKDVTESRPPLKLPFKYENTRDVRVVSLEKDGVLCIPVLGLSDYHSRREQAPEHTHPECLEISCCLRGELTFVCNGAEYPFRSGTVFVSRPDEPHRLLTPNKGLRMYWMFFRIPAPGFSFLNLPPDEAEWLKGKMLGIERHVFPSTRRMHVAFQRILQLYDTVPRGSAERKLLMRSAATELLLSLVEASSETVVPPKGGRVEQLILEMRDNPGRTYTIDGLSEKAALSPSNLAIRFKALVGMPPHAFLIHCRIDKAKTWLRQPGAKISEIAKALGFPSAQHFATQFKVLTGKTPREWKSLQSD